MYFYGMKLTRLIVVAVAGIGYASSLFAQSPLMLPEAMSGTTIDLTIQTGTHAFFEGVETATAGCNGSILGPTLILDKGDFVEFSVTNNLMDTTTMHWHGFHVAAENDGGPHNKIAPGATWTPAFEIMDHAGTYWYHPHLHMMTNAHVSKGVSGMIWVRDEIEQALDLPRTYGVDEFPMIVQTKAFDAEGQIEPASHKTRLPWSTSRWMRCSRFRRNCCASMC